MNKGGRTRAWASPARRRKAVVTVVLVGLLEAMEATSSSGDVSVITTSSVVRRYLGTSLRSSGRFFGAAGIAGSTRLMLVSRYSCASLATSCQALPVMVVFESAY